MSKRIEAKNLDIFYGDFKAVEGVPMMVITLSLSNSNLECISVGSGGIEDLVGPEERYEFSLSDIRN